MEKNFSHDPGHRHPEYNECLLRLRFWSDQIVEVTKELSVKPTPGPDDVQYQTSEVLILISYIQEIVREHLPFYAPKPAP
jgi:hypothetical protein